MGPSAPRSTVLTLVEDAMIVEFRRRTLLPLDDVPGCRRGSIPKPTRSSLHRCLVCDLSDLASVRRAAAEIISLNLPIAGLLDNAGIMPVRATKNALGWDMTFATNHLGPFALTEALVPHRPDRANVVFVASGVEDPERRPAMSAGFRGSRFASAAASARGEWKPAGSTKSGFDGYAPSKQCALATVMEFAREAPRLHFNAVEPGFNPTTAPGRDATVFVRFLVKYLSLPVVPLLMPFMKFLSVPKRAARLIAEVLADASDKTGVRYDESGQPVLGSALVRDPQFQERVAAETRALLSTVT